MLSSSLRMWDAIVGKSLFEKDESTDKFAVLKILSKYSSRNELDIFMCSAEEVESLEEVLAEIKEFLKEQE